MFAGGLSHYGNDLWPINDGRCVLVQFVASQPRMRAIINWPVVPAPNSQHAYLLRRGLPYVIDSGHFQLYSVKRQRVRFLELNSELQDALANRLGWSPPHSSDKPKNAWYPA